MQMIGISRRQMKELLGCDLPDVLFDLHVQCELLSEKRKRLDKAIYFMDYAKQICRDPNSDDWHYLGQVVGAMKAVDDRQEFAKSYLRELRHDKKTNSDR